ncbi:nucleic-acid-binding protein from transposon X-element [Caerostris darwini]|uniref:Nucleic-acid-binding protein from transposon X-element n=1 Tax=Caerostris darwini TaxID=1538125 RepID=A0AAV4V541_9ARAC|nr:nucleic-acid-binding protein from transposon X-element [Caerostris darwini]
MSGRRSPVPDSETMDVGQPGDDEQPPYRLPPDPPVGSDEFLYLHVKTITRIIELNAKLLADWFRPKGLDPETTSKLDKEYDATTAEMLALCEGRRKPKDLTPLPTGNPFSLPTNASLLSNDPTQSTNKQTRKPRLPPFFVCPNTNWIVNMTILKKKIPSIRSVHARDNFLKLPISSEEEHFRLKRKLQELNAEFKCYNLKQDRPVKIVIRGLSACTSQEPIIEAMKFKGFSVLKKIGTFIDQRLKIINIENTQDLAELKQRPFLH